MTWKFMPIPAELCSCGGMRAAWRAATGRPSWTLWHASQASGLTNRAAITEDELDRRGLRLSDALAAHADRVHRARARVDPRSAREAEEETMSSTGPPPAVLRGNCFVITGVLDGYTRDAAHAALRLIGASHADEVGQGVDCLVVGALPARYAQQGTSKERAARSMNIPIMDGDTFVQRLDRERQIKREAARLAAVPTPQPQPVSRPRATPPAPARPAPPPPPPVAPSGVARDAPEASSFADLLAAINRPRTRRP